MQIDPPPPKKTANIYIARGEYSEFIIPLDPPQILYDARKIRVYYPRYNGGCSISLPALYQRSDLNNYVFSFGTSMSFNILVRKQGRSQEFEMGGAKLLGEGSGGRLKPPVGPGQSPGRGQGGKAPRKLYS